MRLTIGKKIGLLVLFLYPWFALAGIIGILGIEATGKISYEIMDQTDFILQLEDLRQTLYKAKIAARDNDLIVLTAYWGILKQQPTQALNFLTEHRGRLGETFNKEKILREIVKEIGSLDIAAANSKIDSLLLGLDILIKNTQEELRNRSSLPYKTQAISITGLTLLSAGMLVLVGIGMTLISRSINRPLKKITEFASTISQLKGDLTQELAVESSDEVGDLAAAFNQMTKNLASLIRQVKENSLKVVNIATQIKEVSEIQAEISLRQSTQVNEASSFIDHLRDTARLISQNTQLVCQSLNQSLEFTQAGIEALNQTVSGIGRIKERVDAIIKQAGVLKEKSMSIDKILGWIEEIAKKIDLLALNADIEATKKEADEGFFLMAKEIRMLSERSQAATEQMRAIINAIHNEIDHTVSFAEVGIQEVKKDLGLIAKSVDTIEKINLSVKEANQKSKDITSSTQEQEKLSQEAVSFISYIQELSKESYSHSQKIQELSRQIDALSHQLKQSVAEFRLE